MNNLEKILGTNLIVNMKDYRIGDEEFIDGMVNVIETGTTTILNLAGTDIIKYVISGLIDYIRANKEYWSELISNEKPPSLDIQSGFLSAGIPGGEYLSIDDELLVNKSFHEALLVVIHTLANNYIKAIDKQNYMKEFEKIIDYPYPW